MNVPWVEFKANHSNMLQVSLYSLIAEKMEQSICTYVVMHVIICYNIICNEPYDETQGWTQFFINF